MIKNKKILLTGGYGFFGNHIYKSLKKRIMFVELEDTKNKINLSSLKKKIFYLML